MKTKCSGNASVSRASLAFLLASLLLTTSCSREERVRVINHFHQEIRVRIEGRDTSPSIPAQGAEVLDHMFYIGNGVRVTILDSKKHKIKDEDVSPPGDSEFRSEAVIEVGP